MAPHPPQPLVAPRRSRGAPRPPTARRAPATPWRASTPHRSSRPGEAVARLDPRPLVAPRRSRGAPRYSDRLLICLFRVTLGGARRVGYHRRIIQTEFLHETVRRIWGYDRFLPLQQEAIDGVLAGRDSLVVLPTGGGKSLCYQAPAAHLRRLPLVLPPPIAPMKDPGAGLAPAGV